MTPWNTDSDSDSDTRKKPIWRTYIFEFLSSHLLQPLAPASTCAQVLDQQLVPRQGSRHPAPPSLRDLNADPPAEDDDHIIHLHGEPLPQPPYFPEPNAAADLDGGRGRCRCRRRRRRRRLAGHMPLHLEINSSNQAPAHNRATQQQASFATGSSSAVLARPQRRSPAEDDDHIVHLHGEPLPQPPYFPEPNAAADLDGGLDGDAEASFPGSNPEADGRELDGDLEQDHSLFMFLDPGEVRCRKRLRASEEDDVDVGDARGPPGRCYDDDVAEDGRSTQSRYSWRPRNADDQSYTHDDDTPAAQEISGEQIAADDTYYDSYYYMDGEYGGAYDEEEHQQDDMAAADFHDGNQLSPEHQRVLDRLFGEADGSTRQEEQEAAAQGSGGEHVPPEEDSYEAAAELAGDDVDEEQLQRQEQVDMTDGTDETF
uniref:Transcription factor Iwr1 domain-containing protein n=1 Tax=Oryza glumipatula TaxID=40148 RepID=A0A0D9YPQ4_9ORYZ